MKSFARRGRSFVIGLSLLILSSADAVGQQTQRPAQQTSEEKGQKDKDAKAAVVVPVYKPPIRGIPGGRIGGGTRGVEREVFVLSVLAPDHSGVTINEQPSLYWFISNPTSLPVEITIMDPQATQPLLETRIPSPARAGIHRIRLADYDVRLSPGKAYRWYVAVVPDFDRRSRDILAGGAIERTEIPASLKGKIIQSGKEDLPRLYAEAGVWYDALAAISDLIDASPSDTALRKQRASLLGQVGLTGISD